MKKTILTVLLSLTLMSFLTVSAFAVSYKRGDVNMDGTVRADDCAKLRKILLSTDDVTDMSDVNQDGAVNIIDLVSLKKMIANPAPSITIPGGNGEKTVITDDWE